MNAKETVIRLVQFGGGLAFVLATSAVWAQTSEQPLCSKDIVKMEAQLPTESCSSYSICTSGFECAEGSTFRTCGPPGPMDSYCSNYISGQANPVTGVCENGLLQMPYTHNGFVMGYPDARVCGAIGGWH